MTQTQKAGRRGRLPICHHFTICNVQRVSLGDQQGLVGHEEGISSSIQAAVSVIPCYNERDAIRQKILFTLYPKVTRTSFNLFMSHIRFLPLTFFIVSRYNKKSFRLMLRGYMGLVFQSYNFKMFRVSLN